MAFDGIVIANLVHDFKSAIEGGRIAKIAQPEKDELLFQIKKDGRLCRLLISASASLPLAYLTDTNKPSPMTAPNFCMLLRKHIGSARIVSVSQPGLERIIEITLEHLDEMGDLRRKYLIVELMGKHSNIIFCDENDMILDSIKHISAQVSSVREVLPGRTYFIPHSGEKKNPLEITEEEFIPLIQGTPQPLSKALYMDLTGLSPVATSEICHLASLDGDVSAKEFSEGELTHLYHALNWIMDDVRKGNFSPSIIYKGEKPVEFSSIPLTMMDGGEYQKTAFDSVSQVLERYYAEKNAVSRIHQKSTDLRKIISNALERSYRKLDLQTKQLKDTEKREKYRLYGELIHTYGYQVPEGAKGFDALNYYTNETIRVPLDPDLTPQENAKKYFERYGKLKRTCEALTELKHARKSSTWIRSPLRWILRKRRRICLRFGRKWRKAAILSINILQRKSSRARAAPIITELRTVLIFMWGRIITRMMSLPSNLQRGTTGGFMQRKCPVLM